MEQVAIDPNTPLSDDYLQAHGNEPDVLPHLTSAERRRLSKLSGEPRMEPAASSDGVGGFLRRAFPPDRPREDGNVLGMPPELVALSGARIATAAATEGAGMAGRAIAGVKAAAGEAAPILKYETIKLALQKMGVPHEAAGVVAMVMSGYRRGGAAKAETAAQAEAATASAPRAARAEPAPAPAAARPETPRTPRAPKAKAPSAPEKTPAATSGFSLTPEEERQAEKWLGAGVKPEVVAQRIVLSRQLTGATGAPSPDVMRAAIEKRNATGRWDE